MGTIKHQDEPTSTRTLMQWRKEIKTEKSEMHRAKGGNVYALMYEINIFIYKKIRVRQCSKYLPGAWWCISPP